MSSQGQELLVVSLLAHPPLLGDLEELRGGLQASPLPSLRRGGGGESYFFLSLESGFGTSLGRAGRAQGAREYEVS